MTDQLAGSVSAGVFVAGRVRDYLKKTAFVDPTFRWVETGGWVVREFTWTASEDRVRSVYEDMKRWVTP